MRLAFKMDFQESTTVIQDNRYYLGAGVLWQNVWGGTGSLTTGSHPGGRWVCKGVSVQDIGLLPPKYIAKFVVPEHILKISIFKRKRPLSFILHVVKLVQLKTGASPATNRILVMLLLRI